MTESVLNDIGAYKDTLLEMLLSNDGICETLLGKGYSNDDKLDLIYSQVYPYLYVDETQTEVLSYICVEVDIPRVPTGTIKDMSGGIIAGNVEEKTAVSGKMLENDRKHRFFLQFQAFEYIISYRVIIM